MNALIEKILRDAEEKRTEFLMEQLEKLILDRFEVECLLYEIYHDIGGEG